MLRFFFASSALLNFLTFPRISAWFAKANSFLAIAGLFTPRDLTHSECVPRVHELVEEITDGIDLQQEAHRDSGRVISIHLPVRVDLIGDECVCGRNSLDAHTLDRNHVITKTSVRWAGIVWIHP
jgi:hypothetical protein